MFEKVLKILFPESCPVCGKPSTGHNTAPICSGCWEGILQYKGAVCLKCGKPLVSDASITCGDCLKEEPAFKWARSFGIYDGALKKAINLFKYYGIKRLSKPLSELMFKIKMPAVDVVVPVPLSKKKLKQREFNHAALLAKYISIYLGTRVTLNCLVKIKETMPQVGLSAKERGKNVRNAFVAKNNEFIKGKNILLVDDVLTTGATIRECSKSLKSAGAGEIYAITLAYSSGDFW